VKASVVVQERDKEDSIIMEDVRFMTPLWATSGPFGLLRNDVDEMSIRWNSTILLGLDRDGKALAEPPVLLNVMVACPHEFLFCPFTSAPSTGFPVRPSVTAWTGIGPECLKGDTSFTELTNSQRTSSPLFTCCWHPSPPTVV
jgi:hypothetical protein